MVSLLTLDQLRLPYIVLEEFREIEGPLRWGDIFMQERKPTSLLFCPDYLSQALPFSLFP
jgi:hypothetical protein